MQELKSLGISMYFEEHGIDTKMVSSEILTAVISACAQAESESISKNTRWSIQKKMQNGTYVASSVPFGFRRENSCSPVRRMRRIGMHTVSMFLFSLTITLR